VFLPNWLNIRCFVHFSSFLNFNFTDGPWLLILLNFLFLAVLTTFYRLPLQATNFTLQQDEIQVNGYSVVP